MNDTDFTSGRTDFRKENTAMSKYMGEMRKCQRNRTAFSQIRAEGAQEILMHRIEAPLHPVERPTVEQAVSTQPLGTTVTRSPCVAHGGAHAGADGCGLKGAHGVPTQEHT